ncbi:MULTISPECIES: LAETG motif-containing sortase-dependent surface protein [unclassified Streptomyces]|uniref:LAETG motif-containing sortase-dependent surface protein n=1 Tax=unclassified Streptomyces TaxID=2593676 RepID=UPI001660E566|nr:MULTISPECIES: LAETG motif-containing sortase-dependent surface protein [unclassified Streptomyces]MBD0710254.1 peptidase [Streptomyces sp. CBMA291]MBD0712879.1 peptidase [Streptomyces sp. CBMA370]
MFSVRGRGAARLAAATLVSSLVVTGAIATAGPALAADGAAGTGGVTAKLGGMSDRGDVEIVEKNGKKWPRTVTGGLFKMQVEGGGTLQTYCIDLRTEAKHDFDYKEVGWGESSLHNNENAGKILWVLENAYPKFSAEALGKKLGVDLSKNEAAAGTQAAIWTFSDDVKATPKSKDARKLTDYLLKEAVKLEEPKASLSLSPSSVAGKAGDRIGPVTVSTNAEIAKVATAPGAPSGVKVVDKDGKAITEAKNGAEVYFDVPAGTPDGTAELTASATTKVSLGRAFVSIDGPSQTLILAGSSDSTVTAKASATWAKKGAVPAVTVAKDCAKGGLEVVASNKGDEDWTFDLKGTSYTVAAGETKTIAVPLAEDEAYKFTITGPNGFAETFEGVLDCETAPPGPQPSETPGTEPSTPAPSPSTPDATTGGTTGGETTGGDTEGGTTGDTTGGDNGTTTGTTGTTGTSTTTGGGDLAETGSSSATPMIAGIAAALVVIGGGAVFFLRRKKATGQ